jgi:hypothetical protein
MPNLVGVPSSGNAEKDATLDQGISPASPSPLPLTGSRKAGTPAAKGKTEQAADTPMVALVMNARRSPSSVESLGSLKMVKKNFGHNSHEALHSKHREPQLSFFSKVKLIRFFRIRRNRKID